MKPFRPSPAEHTKPQFDALVRTAMARNALLTEAGAIDEIKRLSDGARRFTNDAYAVVARRYDNFIHLSICRVDKKPVHDWRDMQEIKNQLVGAEHEAVELYPAESRRVDTANQYHLWVAIDPGYRFPFGFNEGRVVTDSADPDTGAMQRAHAKNS